MDTAPFLCKTQKGKRVDQIYAFATLTLKKEIIPSGLFHSQFFGFALHFYHFLRFLTAKAGRNGKSSATKRKKFSLLAHARRSVKPKNKGVQFK
ncbi:hypothetical protein AQ486_15500 [Enterococcus faecalis]|nr:hypothetical protein AQ486_15500 [Enterococcus faecalis]